MNRILITVMLCLLSLLASAQRTTADRKMSRMVRRIAMEQRLGPRKAPSRDGRTPMLCAFVRITGDANRTFREHGCRELARFGDIYIAAIPKNQLSQLSNCNNIMRIEARESCQALNDTAAIILNALPVYAGEQLPQAFTGRGVVVGVEDIGFDLTHPTFYSRDLSEYRIKRFWDQLSVDTIDSPMFVGAEYLTQEDILAYQHSRDGEKMTHGTHTAGTAAGSGFDTPYRGIAWESDLCLISNAVGDDRQFIDSLDFDKYTSATDALGFKYAFDYADEVGKPCVVSFSEGSHQDWYGDDQLYYEVLSQMVGPGHILVASAGNEGHYNTYLEKPPGESRGTFLSYWKPYVYFTLRADHDFAMRLKVYDPTEPTTYEISQMEKIIELPDSELVDTFYIHDRPWVVAIAAYPSCYNEAQMAYEVYVRCPQLYFNRGVGGSSPPVSFEFVGDEARVELFGNTGLLIANTELEPTFSEGEHRYSIYTPGSAPDVICVGASAYRTQIVNFKGETRVSDNGSNGERAYFSSIGPTYDERTKPDVVAPGTNVISSYSSFYYFKSGALTASYDITHFDWNGRTYVWNADTGTSMSTPMVAGTIALWLQAKPDLTPAEVLDVFAHTCRQHNPDLEYPNNEYGYGKIDAYAGMLYVLGLLNRVEGLSASQPQKLRFELSDDELRLLSDNALRQPIRVSLYSVSGVLVHQQRYVPGENLTVPLSHLAHGVYAVQVDSADPMVKGSTLIRH